MVRFRDYQRVALALFAVSFGANQFAPLILVYIAEADLPEQSVTAMFSIYVAGLLPALLACGVWSDKVGRRAVMRPVVVVSVLATFLMLFGGAHVAFLYLGRLLAGVASGAIFVVGSTWLHELSAPDPHGSGARRSAAALSAGFGGGALVAGVIAQFAPVVFATPYVPHLVIGSLAAVLVWNVPDASVRVTGVGWRQLVPVAARRPRFGFGVAIWAPLAFTCSSIAFISLPTLVAVDAFGVPYLFAGVVTAVTLFTGIWVQPLARRIADEPTGRRIPIIGLLIGAVGLACASGLTLVANPDLAAVLLIPVVLALGAGYGFLLIAGLTEVELQAGPDEHGRLMAVFYTFVYMGLAAPYLLSALSSFGGPARWLLILAAIAVASMIPTILVNRSPSR